MANARWLGVLRRVSNWRRSFDLSSRLRPDCACALNRMTLYCDAVLFDNERLHFFRPLTGKYRGQIVACLRELYARLYSSLADYSRVIGRELVLEVFQEAITRSPVLDDTEDDKSEDFL
jgi:hypothetical protein